jgi:hypothetical protein
VIDRRGPDRPAPARTTEETELMSNDKMRATGYEPVDPWAVLAAHGEAVPPEPDPAVDRTYYRSPGEPPWANQVHQDLAVQHGWPTPGEKRRGLPAWAWVSIVLGSLFLICGSSAAVALWDESGPAPAVSTVPAASPVAVTGTCQKRIVGEYGLVATVRATNSSRTAQTGMVWVQWSITGETPQRFTKPVTIEPGAAVDFPVNHDVPAERWFRTGTCTYGWETVPR